MEERALALKAKKPELDDLKQALGIDRITVQVEELEQQAAQPGFWDDAEKSQEVLKKTGSLKSTIEEYNRLTSLYDDLEVMIEMADEDEDESMIPEIDEQMEELNKGIETARLETLLSGEYDEKDAILTFHAGAGGTEAQDWVSMLYRMYSHWAEAHGYKVTVLDYQEGDEAGIKSASIQIEGRNAYGFLKSENGIFGCPYHPPCDRHRRFLPGGAKPVPEQGRRDENVKVQAARNQDSAASGQDRGHQGRPEADRLGKPDPLLCLYALYDGQGSPYQL